MIPLPQKLKIVQETPTLGFFEIEGLYPGYGVTIGNSLRRVLLSSIEGAAITTVKIEGVPHEFTTIDGVLEDVVTILLNLKNVRFRLDSAEPQIATLEVKGEREVKAGDFQTPPLLKVANPDYKIFTITNPKTEVKMEVKVEKGVGYEPVERRKKEKAPIGEIHLDAVYSPVKRVAFRVENMRVGERTDFDKLFLEIETDGTKTPSEALKEALEILQGQVAELQNLLLRYGVKEAEDTKKEEESASPEPSKIKIEDLSISTRTKEILQEHNIKTVAGLIRKKEEDLKKMKGIGEKAVEEIKEALKELGFSLKE